MKSLEALRILSECANGEKKLLFSDSLDLEKVIKQDLEVLEIIKNKEIDIGFLKSILHDYSNEEALEIYNDYGYRKLTMEELLKLKQWLEEDKDVIQKEY